MSILKETLEDNEFLLNIKTCNRGAVIIDKLKNIVLE